MCDQGKADSSNGNGGIGILSLTLHVDSLDSDFYIAVIDRDRARFTGVDMVGADYLVLVRPGLSDHEHDEMHAVCTTINDPKFLTWTKGRDEPAPEEYPALPPDATVGELATQERIAKVNRLRKLYEEWRGSRSQPGILENKRFFNQ
jgi:hypothetical protein